MDWEQVEKDWSIFLPKAIKRWPLLSFEQLDAAAGNYDQLLELIRENYQTVRADAEKQLGEWRLTLGLTVGSNTSPPRGRSVISSALTAIHHRGPSKAYR